MRTSTLVAALCFSAVLIPTCATAQFHRQWAKSFDGGLSLSDRSSSVVTDSEGSIYMLGTINSSSSDVNANIALYKYDSAGALLWSKTYDGPAHSQDTAFDLALGGDGSVTVVGRVMTASTSSDMITLKYRTSDGQLLWDRQFDGPDHSIDQAVDVVVDGRGNVFVTGEVYNNAEFFVNRDWCTIKYSADGTVVWSKLFDGPGNSLNVHDDPQHIALDSEGNVVVLGNSPDLSRNNDIMTVKYSGVDGATLWEARYLNGGTAASLQIAPNGDVLVSGNTFQTDYKVVLLRYNGITGAEVWAHVDVFPHHGQLIVPFSMAIDAVGNPIISLTYDPDTDNSNLNYNIQTTKYSFADGARIWSTSVGNLDLYDGQNANTVAVDQLGNVMVAGSNLFRPKVAFTVWYFNGVTGALTYTDNFAFPSDTDRPTKIVFDESGNAVAVGDTINNINSYGDLFVIKYQRDSARNVSGHVELQNYAGAVAGLQVAIEIRSTAGALLDSQTASLDAGGNFELATSVPQGTYDILVKASHWLRRRLVNQVIGVAGVSGLSYSLINGDINGNNSISLTDFGMLRAAFASSAGDLNWNPGADLNGDGTVSISDFGILRAHFGTDGD